MKYIVPQDRLKSLMTSYLDDKLVGGVSEVDTFIVIYYYDLRKWFKKHLNINIDEVKTFEYGGEEYIY